MYRGNRPHWPGGDFSNFIPTFEYRVIVSNYDAPDWPPALKSEFENSSTRVASGIVHAADNAFPIYWPAYDLMIGVGGWRGRAANLPVPSGIQGRTIGFRYLAGQRGCSRRRLPFQVTARDPSYRSCAVRRRVWTCTPVTSSTAACADRGKT